MLKTTRIVKLSSIIFVYRSCLSTPKTSQIFKFMMSNFYLPWGQTSCARSTHFRTDPRRLVRRLRSAGATSGLWLRVARRLKTKEADKCDQVSGFGHFPCSALHDSTIHAGGSRIQYSTQNDNWSFQPGLWRHNLNFEASKICRSRNGRGVKIFSGNCGLQIRSFTS